ncbi:Predicted integral membrane protein [Escherichia coli]|uniref:Predicted integral membrane protein n=1 Tax=Escherichia coli TaxID=562 RepID=A0A2X1MEZ8_ECOLX|nr:Predicted integral membrane protein [Escherichia coli]
MKKTTSTALLALTLGSVLAAASAPAMATGDNMEKCYGVSLKGKKRL